MSRIAVLVLGFLLGCSSIFCSLAMHKSISLNFKQLDLDYAWFADESAPTLKTYLFIRNNLSDDERNQLYGCNPITSFKIDTVYRGCVFLELDEKLVKSTVYTNFNVQGESITFDIVRESVGSHALGGLLDKIPQVLKKQYKRTIAGVASDAIDTPRYEVDSAILEFLDVQSLTLIQSDTMNGNAPITISLGEGHSILDRFKNKGRVIDIQVNYEPHWKSVWPF